MTAANANTAYTIRSARAEDYARILDVWTQCALDVEPDGRERESAFRTQLEQFGDYYLVAAEKDRIVGVVLGTHDLRKGWINRLAVLPEFRRRGVASALVRECERRLRGTGVELICALVEPYNAASAKLFGALGFPSDLPVIYFRKRVSPVSESLA